MIRRNGVRDGLKMGDGVMAMEEGDDDRFTAGRSLLDGSSVQ
jgi:hypothetical protein